MQVCREKWIFFLFWWFVKDGNIYYWGKCDKFEKECIFLECPFFSPDDFWTPQIFLIGENTSKEVFLLFFWWFWPKEYVLLGGPVIRAFFYLFCPSSDASSRVLLLRTSFFSILLCFSSMSFYLPSVIYHPESWLVLVFFSGNHLFRGTFLPGSVCRDFSTFSNIGYKVLPKKSVSLEGYPVL